MLNLTLIQSTPTWIIAFIMFVVVVVTYVTGHWFRIRIISRNPDHANREVSTVNGILLALLGLLLAFSFGMANSRFDRRRELVIEEANDIGTAILRADLYPDSTRQLLRNNFREYVEARIYFYKAGMNVEEMVRYFLKADSLGKVIWNIATTDARSNNNMLRSAQMIPALNAMIDITTTRRAAGEETIPDSIMFFLFGLCICSTFLIGYENKGKVDRLTVIGFGIILSITIFTIIDLDRPRSGFINMDVPNQKIVELRQMF